MEEGRHQEDGRLGHELVDSLPQHGLVEVSKKKEAQLIRKCTPTKSAPGHTCFSSHLRHHLWTGMFQLAQKYVTVSEFLKETLKQAGLRMENVPRCVCARHVSCRRQHSPPVLVELSVSKLQKLRDKVHARVEEPVEEYQPDQMVGDLGDERREEAQGQVQALDGKQKVENVCSVLTANFRSRSTILEKSISCG